jgi:putative transcriptional regulator
LRAYVGYAGWSPGQLENELRMNAWVVCPFDASCAALEGEVLWKHLLAAHRPDLRLEADSPDDPGLN